MSDPITRTGLVPGVSRVVVKGPLPSTVIGEPVPVAGPLSDLDLVPEVEAALARIAARDPHTGSDHMGERLHVLVIVGPDARKRNALTAYFDGSPVRVVSWGGPTLGLRIGAVVCEAGVRAAHVGQENEDWWRTSVASHIHPSAEAAKIVVHDVQSELREKLGDLMSDGALTPDGVRIFTGAAGVGVDAGGAGGRPLKGFAPYRPYGEEARWDGVKLVQLLGAMAKRDLAKMRITSIASEVRIECTDGRETGTAELHFTILAVW